MPRKQPKADGKSQPQRFRDVARDLECDESEERFDEALRRLGKKSKKAKPTKL